MIKSLRNQPDSWLNEKTMPHVIGYNGYELNTSAGPSGLSRRQREIEYYQMPVNVHDMGSNVVLDSPNHHPGRYPMSLPSMRVAPPSMYKEVERLKTFSNWPVAFIPKERMASAGFYFTQRRDIVRCPFCDVEVMNWEEGDDPWIDHHRWKPTCAFINHVPGNGNIAIDEEIHLQQETSPNDSGYDTCGSMDIRGMDFRQPEERSSILKTKKLSFPEYANPEIRLQSFNSWPVSLKIKAKTLCDAGFYYTGKGDQTICFYCGGGLKDWEDSDDPWIEHAKWFSKCTFVLLSKGEQFVDNAKKLVQGWPDKPSLQEQEGANKMPKVKLGSTEKKESVAKAVSSSSASSTASASDATLCKICYSRGLEVVFLPCGHLMSCVTCSLQLTTCGVCRKPITSMVRTFLP